MFIQSVGIPQFETWAFNASDGSVFFADEAVEKLTRAVGSIKPKASGRW
jgi:hypothetical protein